LNVSRKKRVVGKVYIKTLEQSAFLLETFRLPGLKRQHEKQIANLYKTANLVRKDLGEKPKQYFTIKKRKVVPI